MLEYIEYLGDCVKWAFHRYEWMEKLATSIVIIIIVFGVGGASVALLFNNDNWLFAVIPLGVLGFIVLFVAPFFVYRSERRKVKKYESQAIELFFEEDNDQFLHKRGENWIFRIGIKTTGIISITNVEVKLIEIDNKRNAYSDAPLRPAYCLPGEPSGFILKPGEYKFVELVSWGVGDNEMKIHYHYNYQLKLRDNGNYLIGPYMLYDAIPKGRHRITLQATGNNTNMVTETYIISTSGEVPTWERI